MAQTLYIDNKDGYGPRDFTTCLWDADQFLTHDKNQPQLFDFRIIQHSAATEFVIPKHGAFVRFIDDRWESRHTPYVDSGVVFTGYVTEDADPILLGTKAGQKVYGWRIQCTSEEFLANSKRLPAKTYVNTSRGEILKDLLQEMFKASTPFPYSTDGIFPGGTEQLYQVNTSQTWAEVAATFADADGYTYWIIDSFVYYGPEGPATSISSSAYRLVIDEYDPRFTADGLSINRVARDIINDVTILGEDEPTDFVKETFVSDGYQGAHNLAFDPYGLEELTLVEDDFTAELDTQKWSEVDPGDYIQFFNGALNIVGGPGDPGTTNPASVYLAARKPIELSGVIEFRDGEIYFPPGATGYGIIGGCFTDATYAINKCWHGWLVNCNTSTITGLSQGGIPTTAAYYFVPTRHYILRRTLQIGRQLSTQEFTQTGTGAGYNFDSGDTPVEVYMSYIIEEINNDDPANVFTTITTLGALRATLAVPRYVLYAASVPYTIHYVTNFLSVRRPQQAVLKVNGKQQLLGSFLDGGKATLQSDNGKGKLAWYQIPGAPGTLPSYTNTVLGETTSQVTGDGIIAYWKLDETTGTTRVDSSGKGHTGTAVNVTQGGVSPILSENGWSNIFDGSTSYISGAGFASAFAGAGTFEAWFNTTNALHNTIFSTRDLAGAGEFYQVINGQIYFGSNFGGAFTSTRTGLNDGRWHHLVVTYANGGGANCNLYIDGVLDSSLVVPRFPPANTWYIGKDIHDISITGQGWFNGAIDEVAIYYNTVLTPSQVKAHYTRAISQSTSTITVPKVGSTVQLSYYRKQQSRARVRSQESINTERERYGDDGIRQKVIRADEISPAPRTSEECLALAQATLYDSSRLRFEGTYSFETLENNVTSLLLWPRPGDEVELNMDLPDESVTETVTIQSVSSNFLGNGAYKIQLGFGPVNRFDIVVRNLILKRRTTLDDPSIQDSEVEDLSDIASGLPYPADLTDCEVDQASVSATQFTINLAAAGIPADVVNYEVRTDDTGWGQGNYAARFRATSQVVFRTKREHLYYIRPYNAAGRYSRRSAVIRVVAPLANTYTVTGVTGDINSQRVRIIVPLPLDPDYGGVMVVQNDAVQTLYYKGNADINELVAAGVTALLSAGKMTIDIPNTGFGASFSARVYTYNLLGLLSTPQDITISGAADGSWRAQAWSPGLFTASAGTWGVGAGDQVVFNYTRSADTMTVGVELSGTTVSTTPSFLKITVPTGLTARSTNSSSCTLVLNGTVVPGVLSINSGEDYIRVRRADGTTFPSSTDATTVIGQISFEV